ncbi:MAG: PAS domain S-box protein [Verrucomicrobiia bacterium]
MSSQSINPCTELEERLRFETLIAELSSRFVNLPADQVDREITDAERRLCEHLGLDVAGLWQWSSETPGNLYLTHLYGAVDAPLPQRMRASDYFPWHQQQMLAGRVVRFSRLSQLPSEAGRDAEVYRHFGIKSNVTVPLMVGGEPPIGALGFNTTRAERDWPDALVNRLQLIAEIFTNALARKRSDEILRQSEERLSLAAEAAGAGLWSLDLATGVFWLTDKTRELFGFAADAVVTFEDFLKLVHPEDQDLVRQAARKLMVSGKEDQVEYRVVLSDGRVHWILSRGRVPAGGAGKSGHLMGVSIRITSRKRIEESLRASEARLQAGADLAGLGHYEVDYGARTCFLDQRFRQICGVPAEVNQGLDPVAFWLERVLPEDRQRLLDERQRLHEGKIGQISLEYRYLHPVFGARWIHHLARLTERHSGGGGVRTFGVIRDITETRQIAEQQEENLRFGTLIADLSSKFVNLAPGEVDGAIIDAQRRVCEFLGLDLSALWQPAEDVPEDYRLTHHYRSLAGPPITRMSARSNFPWCEQQLKAGNVIALSSLDELPPQAARDQEVWRLFGVKTSLTLPLSTGGGPAIGFLSFNDIRKGREWPKALVQRLQFIAQMFTNALARKRSDESLRESVEVNRATFEQAAVGMAHVGSDGHWLRVNDRLCAIVGYSREELMSLTFQDLTHPDDLEKDLDSMRQMLTGAIKTYSVEKRYFRKDQSLVWVNLAVSLVRTERGEPKHFIAVVEDITERKRAEEEMQRLRLELWHADRVAQTGAITASLAHELNQPLTGILSTAQAGLRFLAGGNPDPALVHEVLSNIVHDTKRAGAVINGLRAMLRRKETQREPISLADTVREILGLLHSELVGRQVEHRLRVESDAQVLCDKAQIQQVLLNLILNALEAMQEQPPEQRRLELTVERTATGEAIFAVRDSGPGIPQEQQEKLFMAFWTTKPQGMGIGLSISHSIIAAHGGRMWGANNSEGGATFGFTLPALEDQGPGIEGGAE